MVIFGFFSVCKNNILKHNINVCAYSLINHSREIIFAAGIIHLNALTVQSEVRQNTTVPDCFQRYTSCLSALGCLYLLRLSAWAGSAHANIVESVNMTHLLRNRPPFCSVSHQSSRATGVLMCKTALRPGIYWSFDWCEGMTTDRIAKKHLGSFYKPDCIIKQMETVHGPSVLLFWPKIFICQIDSSRATCLELYVNWRNRIVFIRYI